MECSVANCKKVIVAKGFCGMHYYRSRNGLPMEATTEELEEQRRRKISATKTGVPPSEAHRAAISATLKKAYAEGRKPTGGTHQTPEARERQRQITLKSWQNGLLDKSGLTIGATRSSAERAACWTPEKRAAQAKRTLGAYQDGRMQVHGRNRGKWTIYNGPKGIIKMRSKSESIFAYDLDSQDLDWQYEPKRFDLGWATYCPDFYLPAFDRYIEVKGQWNEISRRKFDEFSQTHTTSVILAQDLLKML